MMLHALHSPRSFLVVLALAVSGCNSGQDFSQNAPHGFYVESIERDCTEEPNGFVFSNEGFIIKNPGEADLEFNSISKKLSQTHNIEGYEADYTVTYTDPSNGSTLKGQFHLHSTTPTQLFVPRIYVDVYSEGKVLQKQFFEVGNLYLCEL